MRRLFLEVHQFFWLSPSPRAVTGAEEAVTTRTDALISACHSIPSTLDSSSYICGIFLDITTAFDSLSHSSLLNILNSINLPPPGYNHILSRQWRTTPCGRPVRDLPQGSILGLLEHTSSINDIVSLDSSDLYADYISTFPSSHLT